MWTEKSGRSQRAQRREMRNCGCGRLGRSESSLGWRQMVSFRRNSLTWVLQVKLAWNV